MNKIVKSSIAFSNSTLRRPYTNKRITLNKQGNVNYYLEVTISDEEIEKFCTEMKQVALSKIQCGMFKGTTRYVFVDKRE